MTMFKVSVVEDAYGHYFIEAADAEEAKRKVLGGGMTDEEVQSFVDLGHDNVDVVSVEDAR